MGVHNHYRDTGFARGGQGWLGLNQTIRELRAMGEHVLTAAKAALKDGADAVVVDAKALCPVRTGRLRDSIKAVPNKDGTVYMIVADASKEIKNAKIRADSLENGGDGRFYYGAVVEFSPREGYRPFLYPALEMHRREIADNIDKAIDRASKGV